jgi:hypothetical protein
MNSNNSGGIIKTEKKLLKRRNFFYYIGAAAAAGFAASFIPFRFFKKENESPRVSSIKVKENPYSVKRGSNNG